MTATPLECEGCGSGLRGSDARPGWYCAGERILCSGCCATNRIACDGEGYPYVADWTCRHGVIGYDECRLCDAKDSKAVQL